MGETYIEKLGKESPPLYPRGITREEFNIVARGLRRTTTVGREPSGLPITVEGQIIAEALELNRQRFDQIKGEKDG